MRLRRKGTPMLFAKHITALHDSPVSLEGLCRQQYKHGVGCAEAARRSDSAVEIKELAGIMAASRLRAREGASARLRKALRLPLTLGLARRLMLEVARALEATAPEWDFLSPLYRFVIGLYFTAGVRDGWARFAPDRH
jgi:hypothetical protein